MARIVEILVGVNALGGIATFLGLRYAVRRFRDKIVPGGRKEADDGNR